MIIGLDYSMSCPAMTILDPNCEFLQSKIYFLTNTKKFDGCFGNVTGTLHKDYKNSMERYENIAEWVLSHIPVDSTVYLEDYSMGSKGQVFSIAENTGIMKFLLYKNEIPVKLVAPKTIKKFLTLNGNADKDKMYDAFLDKTKIDLVAQLHTVRMTKITSPISDIVDSWALALYGNSL